MYFVISTIAPSLYHSSNGCKVKLSLHVEKHVRLNSFIIPETKSATLISGANVAKSTSPEKVCVVPVVVYCTEVVLNEPETICVNSCS